MNVVKSIISIVENVGIVQTIILRNVKFIPRIYMEKAKFIFEKSESKNFWLSEINYVGSSCSCSSNSWKFFWRVGFNCQNKILTPKNIQIMMSRMERAQ